MKSTSSILKMEVVYSFEMSVNCRTTGHNFQDDSNYGCLILTSNEPEIMSSMIMKMYVIIFGKVTLGCVLGNYGR
jgi:hypothetical protein